MRWPSPACSASTSSTTRGATASASTTPPTPSTSPPRRSTDRGATVVFAAGNSGSENGEASVSPFNQAPWVISVAAGTVERQRGDFSSNGLEFDNGAAAPIGAGGHTVFTGDRVGNTQPDVMAPGVDISSSCDSTGSVIGPCPEHGQAEASGTSMAAPHVAGAAAVLEQAKPRLSPLQVQQALTATATPVRAEGKRLGSWQVGYGHVNLDKAVRLVTAKKQWKQKLAKAHAKADRRLARQDGYRVVRSDLWQEAAPAAVAMGSYSATHQVTVGAKPRRSRSSSSTRPPGRPAPTSSASPRSSRTPRARRSAPPPTDLLYSHRHRPRPGARA